MRHLLLALTLLSCGEKPQDSGLCDSAAHLTDDNFGRGFMEKHCTGCHSSLLRADQRQGAPVGVDLDSYGQVLSFAARVEARVLSEGGPTMPPGGGPTDEELTMLAEWMRCQVWPDYAAWKGEE